MQATEGAAPTGTSPAPKPPCPMTEHLLKARTGDRVAFAAFVNLVQDRLYNAMLRMTGHSDDALDLTQEALTRCFEKVDSFRGESSAYTWVCRIAMNLAISKQRGARVRRAVSIDQPASDAPDDQMSALRRKLASPDAAPDQIALDREKRELILKALAAIDTRERALLIMRDIDGLEYADIAEALDIPLGTVKSRLFRARLALRSQFQALER